MREVKRGVKSNNELENVIAGIGLLDRTIGTKLEISSYLTYGVGIQD